MAKLFPGDYVRGHIPSNAALLASTALFVVFSIVTAWTCARFAPSNSGNHVLWFFVIGEMMAHRFVDSKLEQRWPHWYTRAWRLSWPLS